MSNPSETYPTSPAGSLPALEGSPPVPLDQALRQLGFPAPRLVSGRASVADWFRPAERSGLYVLLFENGECFGGRTSDVVWQYAGHARTEVDIAWLAFRPLPEQAIEQELERLTGILDGRALRQAMSELLPKAETDFDLLMPVQEQRRWLSDLGYADHSGRRPVDTALRQKYRRNYERFLRAPFAPQAISALRIYAWQGIPILAPGEISFPKILPAIRQFNLRLLRKGPCSSGHYHCLNLADHLLENS